VTGKHGKPLTPPDGITFDGLIPRLSVTPSGDVWALKAEKRQIASFPKSDSTQGKLLCERENAERCARGIWTKL
jgi:hypothetical protein